MSRSRVTHSRLWIASPIAEVTSTSQRRAFQPPISRLSSLGSTETSGFQVAAIRRISSGSIDSRSIGSSSTL
jgi:hypothetical protein